MNYVGSKDRADKIVKRINTYIEDEHIDLFIDYCAGGLNVSKNIICKRIIINDNDKALAMLYNRLIRTDLPFKDISKERYLELKAEKDDPSKLTWEHGFASTQASFRNLRWGGYCSDDKRAQNLRKIEKTRQLIKDKNIIAIWNNDCCSIDVGALENINPPQNTLIYFDPPYYETAAIYRKNMKKEGWFEYMYMIDSIRLLVKRGFHVMISERITPAFMDVLLGYGFTTERLEQQALNNNLTTKGDSKIEELLLIRKLED